MILNQITIPCLDYGTSVAFYKQLGMTQIVDAPPRYARFESHDGSGATLSLHAVEQATQHGVVVYFDYPSADDLDRHVNVLVDKGVQFDALPEDQSWGWREARLKDPAGNEVCLMFAGDNRRFPSWRLRG